jgi:hypothetical protein
MGLTEHTSTDIDADPLMAMLGNNLATQSASTSDIQEQGRVLIGLGRQIQEFQASFGHL